MIKTEAFWVEVHQPERCIIAVLITAVLLGPMVGADTLRVGVEYSA